mmetsp:Transcript_68469/g.101689  ORF Transcript_68469/g.101689 Transcript_68469/m.101689 type:complete len:416 (-) Transcript_68469:138-1385(-)
MTEAVTSSLRKMVRTSSLRKIVRSSSLRKVVENFENGDENDACPEEEMKLVLENDQLSSSNSLAKRRIRFGRKVVLGATAVVFMVGISSFDHGIPTSSSIDRLDTGEIPHNMVLKLADVMDPILGTDTPLLWGTTMLDTIFAQRYYGQCIGIVQASMSHPSGPLSDVLDEMSLDVFANSENGRLSVNVDMSTYSGIERAKKLGLAQSKLADIIISPHLHDTIHIFDVYHKGRFFAFFEHPVKRTASVFFYNRSMNRLQQYGSEYQREDDESMRSALFDHTSNGGGEQNRLVQTLTHKMGQRATLADIAVAKDVLRRKCIVGLTSNFDGSLKRFNHYFGWDQRMENQLNNDKGSERDCSQEVIDRRASDYNFNFPQIDEGTPLWDEIEKANELDMELYRYILELFEEQSSMFSSVM